MSQERISTKDMLSSYIGGSLKIGHLVSVMCS